MTAKNKGLNKVIKLSLAFIMSASGLSITTHAADKPTPGRFAPRLTVTPDAAALSCAAAAGATASTSSAAPVVTKKRATTPYQPIGYVTSELLEKLGSKHTILFTDLYFSVLGKALRQQGGFEKIVSKDGQFFDKLDKDDSKRALEVVSKQTETNVQIQAEIATDMWTQISTSFHLEDSNYDSGSAARYAKEADYDSVEDYEATRNYLLTIITQKREVIEVFRLSLETGVKASLNNRSLTKALAITGATTAGVALLTFIVGSIMTSNPAGDTSAAPAVLTFLSMPITALMTYFKVAPPTSGILRRVHVRLLLRKNRKLLQAKGLLDSKSGNENTGVIEAAHADVESLSEQVTVDKIEAVLPDLPASTKGSDVDTAMMTSGQQLGTYLASQSAYYIAVSKDWEARKKTMGDPLQSLAELLQLIVSKKANQSVPQGTHIALGKFSEQITAAYKKAIEIEVEFEALRKQFDLHATTLERYLTARDLELDDDAKTQIKKKIENMRRLSATTVATSKANDLLKRTLETDQGGTTEALNAIAAINAGQALSATEATRFMSAVDGLLQSVGQAEAREQTREERRTAKASAK